jgi:predicted nucleic acid-binding protein
MLLVDTCVLVDVVENDPQWAGWSTSQLRAQASIHALVINPVIYAELSLCFSSREKLDLALSALQLQLHEPPRPALFLAARAHLQYRQRGGSKLTVLPDFFIGAHAAVQGWPLLTRDATRFRTYFPTLDVIAP